MPSLLPTPEPADPVEGQPGHFEHSNWLKASVKALDSGVVHKAGDSMTGPLTVTGSVYAKEVTAESLAIQGDSAVGPAYNGTIWRNSGATPDQIAFRHSASGNVVRIKHGDPVDPDDGATKGYVDRNMICGVAPVVLDNDGFGVISDTYLATGYRIYSVMQATLADPPFFCRIDVNGAGGAVQCFSSGSPVAPVRSQTVWVAFIAKKV